MPQTLKLAVAQSHTLPDTAATLAALSETTAAAAAAGVDLILFPEAYLGGYPRTCTFGAAVGARDPAGREQFLHYFRSAVDLGDTPDGADDAWLDRTLPLPAARDAGQLGSSSGAGAGASPHVGCRGDGTREALERIARDAGVFVVTGLVERAGGSLYCACVYVCPRRGVVGKRRKVMPTGSERLIWAQGQPRSLRAVTAVLRGVRVTLAAAICWENYMPLLRHSLYSQNVNLYLAPTADARDTWLPLMRTIGVEGRCFVLSANQCQQRKHLPQWITGKPPAKAAEMTSGTTTTTTGAAQLHRRRRTSTVVKTREGHELNLPGGNGLASDETAEPLWESGKDAPHSPADDQASAAFAAADLNGDDEFVTRGGSCIVSPFGEVLAGPLWEVTEGGTLTVEVDLDDCERGRLDLDVAGSYSRSDAFKLTVAGLDLTPPP